MWTRLEKQVLTEAHEDSVMTSRAKLLSRTTVAFVLATVGVLLWLFFARAAGSDRRFAHSGLISREFPFA